MKRLFFFGAICALLLSSCEKADTIEQQEQNTNTKAVTFVMKGITVDYATRATLQSESITDLWLYEGTTLLKHQVSTDSDFGQPTVTLDYGSHDLTFVASKSAGQAFGTEWTCTKVADTYGKVMNVTVSKGSSTSRQVELKRANAKVMWTIEDAIPQDVAKATVSVTNYLGLSDVLAGVGQDTYEAEMSLASYVGKTNVAPSVLVLPATYGEECDVTAVITFKRTDGTTVASYTTNTTVKSNRCTNIHGNFFAKGDANTLTIDTQWLTQKDVDL